MNVKWSNCACLLIVAHEQRFRKELVKMNMFPMAFFAENPIAIFVLLLLALLFFGHKLPGLARGLGSSVNEFKKGLKEGEDEAAAAAPPEKKAAPAVTEEKK